MRVSFIIKWGRKILTYITCRFFPFLPVVFHSHKITKEDSGESETRYMSGFKLVPRYSRTHGPRFDGTFWFSLLIGFGPGFALALVQGDFVLRNVTLFDPSWLSPRPIWTPRPGHHGEPSVRIHIGWLVNKIVHSGAMIKKSKFYNVF